MDGNLAFLLEDGGMRMDAFAAMHGIAVSLLHAVRGRIAGGRGRRVVRQARALEGLASALADAYRDRGDGPDLARVVAAMTRVDACEIAGIDHDELIELPTDFPFRRLTLNPPQMALVATMRLRHGLLCELLACDDPRRALQLHAVRGLERDLVKMAMALDRGDITPFAALEWLVPPVRAGRWCDSAGRSASAARR